MVNAGSKITEAELAYFEMDRSIIKMDHMDHNEVTRKSPKF